MYLFVFLALLRNRLQCSLHLARHVHFTFHTLMEAFLLLNGYLMQMNMLFDVK